MKQIRVLIPDGYSIAQEVNACVARLWEADIPAHQDKEEEGLGVLSVEEDSALQRALTILRAAGFEVVRGFAQ